MVPCSSGKPAGKQMIIHFRRAASTDPINRDWFECTQRTPIRAAAMPASALLTEALFLKLKRFAKTARYSKGQVAWRKEARRLRL